MKGGNSNGHGHQAVPTVIGDPTLTTDQQLVGMVGDDTLIGGSGNDTIYGGAVENGGDGNDRLIADINIQTMTGGAGNDSFEFRNWQDGLTFNEATGLYEGTPPTITDYQAGEPIKLDFMQGVDGNREASFDPSTSLLHLHFDNSWTSFDMFIKVLGGDDPTAGVVWA